MSEKPVFDILGQPLKRIQFVNDCWVITVENGCQVVLGSNGDAHDMAFSAPKDGNGNWLGSLNGSTIPDPIRTPEETVAEMKAISDGVSSFFDSLDNNNALSRQND